MLDAALEKSRRWAWSRFFRERDRCEQMALWAGELAEWLDRVDDLPPEAVELQQLVRKSLTQQDLEACRRYVSAVSHERLQFDP